MTEEKNKKLKTIKLKGKDYVEVKERVLFFNEEYENGKIVTEELISPDGWVRFRAIVTPDVTTPDRFFTGSAASVGSLKGEKAYEKLETVAVGRALALMGIGILEGVASADEIEKFHSTPSAKQQDDRYWTNDDLKRLYEEANFQLNSAVSKAGRPYYVLIDQNTGEQKLITKEIYDRLIKNQEAKQLQHVEETFGTQN